MKLVTFDRKSERGRVGVLVDDDHTVLDLARAARETGRQPPAVFRSMQDVIEGGTAALDLARVLVNAAPPHASYSIDTVQLRAPLPRPQQLRCFAAFEKHARQSARAMMQTMASQAKDPDAALAELEASGRFQIPPLWYERPLYYKGNRFSVIGPEVDVSWPAYSSLIDYELELGCVIGREGIDIPEERANEYIFGFTIFNDLSARDAQAIEMRAPLGPAKGKDFDGGNVLGPCLVTADALDPYDLVMIARVNGSEWSRGHSGDMHHTFADMIAYVSQAETIYPGEVFLSGCVGDGCGLEQLKYLARGDVVELEIDGIGILRNRIV